MESVALGWQHYRAGQYAEAERLCRQLLAAEADNADVWRLLGLAQLHQGRAGEAEASCRHALCARPDYAEAHSALGIVLATQNRMEEAVACFRQALALAPGSAEAYYNLGLILARLGRHAEAVEELRQTVRLDAGHLEAHLRLGNALVQLGRFDEAAITFQAAAQLAPTAAEAVLGLGVARACLRRLDEAIPCFQRACELAPDRPDAQQFLGNSLRARGRLVEALAAYDRAVALRPRWAEAHFNRGFTLDDLRRTPEALAGFDEAIRLKPDYTEAYHNRGVALGKLARYDEALADFDQAIRFSPDYPEAHRNRALVLLVQGKLEEGWREFEWRWRCVDLAMPRYPQPLWNGEPLDGRTILLHVEQGLGDTIQFIRYAALVQARGGRVIVESPKQLAELLETCPGIDRVVPKGEALPAYDLHTPLMRLMGFFTPSVATIPAPVPYLRADADRCAFWRERLGRMPGFKVGIAWQGNPWHSRDRDRSFPLTQLGRLAAVEGVQLVSVQKQPGAEQLRELGGRFPVLDLGGELDADGNVRDTPALMMSLDLVVTADTMVAHLAGALGVPVWIALPLAPDWRWLIGREDSPWYPTARLFRQLERGQWDPVFERMAAALQSVHRSRSAEK